MIDGRTSRTVWRTASEIGQVERPAGRVTAAWRGRAGRGDDLSQRRERREQLAADLAGGAD